jgi:hypothetical protein
MDAARSPAPSPEQGRADIIADVTADVTADMTADGASLSPALPPVAVVDIDGVVADVRHRVPYLEEYPPDWAGFFSAADLDPPIAHGLARVRGLVASGHEIVWLTGRPEWLRSVTRSWLAGHRLPTGTLLMRPVHDRRPARVLKAGALRALAAGRSVFGRRPGPPREIAVVVDDDTAVVARLRADGWPVEQADWLDLDPGGADRLAEAQERDGRT